MEKNSSEIIIEPALEQPREELVSEYKKVFQQLINLRPSGTRNKIATALGKNKSFVSQITNPAYSVPIPARHLETIFNICHFSVKERKSLLHHYTAAHPNYHFRRETGDNEPPPAAQRTLAIEVPLLDNPADQQRAEEMIGSFARQLFELLRSKRP